MVRERVAAVGKRRITMPIKIAIKTKFTQFSAGQLKI